MVMEGFTVTALALSSPGIAWIHLTYTNSLFKNVDTCHRSSHFRVFSYFMFQNPIPDSSLPFP